MVDLRRARADDALAVAKVHVRSWQVAYRGLISQSYLDGLRPEARASRYVFDQANPAGPLTLVAVDGDAICGFVTTSASRDADLQGAGEIRAIYVDPDRWGGGVGRLLMATAVGELGRARFSQAALWVLEDNDRAQRFYELDGWQRDGSKRTEIFGGSAVSELRYRRSIQLP
jgi:ribosomal protein S18 acetylase RimI-like enzyme